MAVLTSSDFQFIKKWIQGEPAVNDEFKGWALDKQTWKDAFQVVEDYEVAGFNTTPITGKRAIIELETGPTTSIRAQYLWLAWVSWRSWKKLG